MTRIFLRKCGTCLKGCGKGCGMITLDYYRYAFIKDNYLLSLILYTFINCVCSKCDSAYLSLVLRTYPGRNVLVTEFGR